MNKYTVIYTINNFDNSDSEFLEFFVCMADDPLHAEEQCLDAYPECDIVWINLGLNFTIDSLED